MLGHRPWAIAKNEFRVLRNEPFGFLVQTLMPLAIMAFLRPSFQFALQAEGVANANGAEQVVPGMAVMFGLFLMWHTSFAFFREHGWGTWNRLRASAATSAEILAGKSVVPLLQGSLHAAILLGPGGWLFGLHVSGSVWAMAAVAAAFVVCVVMLGLVLLGLCRTAMQMNAVANLGAIVLAGLGGAIAPLSAMPRWAAAISPATPGYWAMRGYRAAILESGGLGSVLRPVGVLAGYAVLFAVIAWWLIRFSDVKASWA
jgi:ABC-2 type transport system permease protein